MRYKSGIASRDQISFSPQCFDEMVDENNPVRAFDAFVDTLDISGFTHAVTKRVGQKPYSPKDMLKLYIYGYFNGIRTSRKLEKECGRNIELMWLLNKLAPDYKTISDFRRDNKQALMGVFRQFTVFCMELGLIGREIAAIDGSKFRANNSRKANYTKGKLAKQLEYHRENAKKYIELLDSNDITETAEPDLGKMKIAEKLQRALGKIRELEQIEKTVNASGELSLTDPDARHMSVSNNGTDISHNIQIAVDAKNKLVAAVDVTSDPADSAQLYKMASQVKEVFEADELTALADKGYYRGEDLKKCQDNGIKAVVSKQKPANRTGCEDFGKDRFTYDKDRDVYICPQGKELKYIGMLEDGRRRYRCKNCKDCPALSSCTTSPKQRDITRSKYEEVYEKADSLFKENLSLYKQRQEIVEHPFGTVKRSLGYTHLLLRTNAGAKTEACMFFLAFNLKRVLNILGNKPFIEAMRAKNLLFFNLFFVFLTYLLFSQLSLPKSKTA